MQEYCIDSGSLLLLNEPEIDILYNKVNFVDSISAGDFVDFISVGDFVEISETSQTIFTAL